MARPATQYVCQSCGSSHNRWAGKCESCGGWNTIVEEVKQDRPPAGLDGRQMPVEAPNGQAADHTGWSVIILVFCNFLRGSLFTLHPRQCY